MPPTSPAPLAELDLEAALAALAARAQPVAERETLAPSAAARRMLAEPVLAPRALPPFDNAAMDGYALRHADAAAPLREVGASLAGHPFDGAVAPGTCVRIMTGAPLPPGADTVVMREDVQLADAHVQVLRPPSPGANIRRAGEYVAAGAIALAAGTTLGAVELGVLAALGVERVTVRRALRVAVASTGDELRDAPVALTTGTTYDANRPTICEVLRTHGFAVSDLGICGDRPDELTALRARAAHDACDVLLLTGGAALGDADVVRRSGAVEFVPFNVRPGRGIAIGRLDADGAGLLLGLPGNAVAAFVMLRLLALPLLRHLAGAPLRPVRHVPVRLAAPVQRRGGRIDYLRAAWTDDAEFGPALAPLADQSSASLLNVAQAAALLALGPQSSYARGDLVPAVMLHDDR